MKAVVTGMIASYPVGGVAWDYGQYALGLERLGFDVYYLEDTGWQTYDPVAGYYLDDCSYGVAFLGRYLAQLSPSLGERWHFRAMDGESFGLDAHRIEKIVAEADLFLNVSGGTLCRDAYLACPCKVLIDTDPGWNQFVNYPRWDANPGWYGSHGYRAHDHFFTYAERMGQRDCVLPDLGISWRPTRPPVVCDAWEERAPGRSWTTVMSWDNFRRPIEYQGKSYGTKELEFPKIEDLPTRAPASCFELAVGGSDVPVADWRALGWNVVDSHSVSVTPDDYRHYIECSRGEFSIAKNVYVDTRSGWFSCRSVCYLAAGRPVVVQDTGFSENLPTGEGLLAFSDVGEAVAAIEAVEADYPRHQEAARAIAREHFAAERVLGRLLADVGLR